MRGSDRALFSAWGITEGFYLGLGKKTILVSVEGGDYMRRKKRL